MLGCDFRLLVLFVHAQYLNRNGDIPEGQCKNPPKNMEIWLSPFWRYGYDMATVDKVVRNIYITNKCIYVDICLIILIYLFIHGFIYI